MFFKVRQAATATKTKNGLANQPHKARTILYNTGAPPTRTVFFPLFKLSKGAAGDPKNQKQSVRSSLEQTPACRSFSTEQAP